MKTKQVIPVDEWDKLVTKTYGRPYNFQQQDDCQGRGNFSLTVPAELEEEWPDSVPEKVNGPERGVNFAAWLARDPKQPLSTPDDGCEKQRWCINLWWGRNFYPPIQAVANDLHAKGLLEAGEHTINIDW